MAMTRTLRSSPGPGASGTLTVRRATLDDLDHVVAMRLALLRENAHNPLYGRLRHDAAKRARTIFANQLRNEDELTLLAELEGEVAGILRCMVGEGSPLLHPARYGYLASAYVMPTARRRGILRALLREAEAWCRTHGLTELRLHNAFDSNAASATWEALGFQAVEVLRLRSIRSE
jgi:ribosomal protein S18 acetylase RimI-like enzyme